MSSVEAIVSGENGVVKRLPDLVINQISAGEVVDRPASVVRELVDNSIDAGASEIHVYLEEGGSGLIRVMDNGVGMTPKDAALAFERHATSKIAVAEDLNSISTLGFRGEALPSIASVARVRLRTQQRGSIQGTSLLIAGGEITTPECCTIAAGTDIEVRNLFFNTPARKKFLKTARTEEARVKNWLRQSAIANPSVQYRYYSEGKEIFNLAPRTNSVERARELFKGAQIGIAESIEYFSIEGLVSHPSLAQGESGGFVLLVNGRLVSDRMLLRAVRDGFDSTLKAGEHPVGFLALTVAPAVVDVNVHPQKSEVRFIAPQSVFSLVRSVVRRGVMNFSGALPQAALERQTVAASSDRYSNFQRPAPLFRAHHSELSQERGGATTISSQPQIVFGTEAPLREQGVPIRFSELRFVGQVFSCYLFAELDSQLYVVDMHAAHERIMFNQIRRVRSLRVKQSQTLLIPLDISLNEIQLAQIGEFKPYLEESGFVLSLTESAVSIKEIPSFLSEKVVQQIFHEVALLPEDASAVGVLAERFDAVFARLACHASVRSGRELERAEVYALFAQMDNAELANACPHGRPVVVSFHEAEIEGWFGRDR